jgi:hypothetical protein
MKDPDHSLTLIYFVNDSVDMRLFPVEQVSQLASFSFGFRSQRTTPRERGQTINGILKAVEPSRCGSRFCDILFEVKDFKVEQRTNGELNAVCHICDEFCQRPLLQEECGHA